MSSILPTPSMQLARTFLDLKSEDVIQMNAFDLFKHQMESGSTEACVDAMKRLPVVAVAMGEQSTVQELVPYVTQLVLQSPPPVDELLLLLGQNIVYVSNFINNTSQNKHITVFLPMLERLATIEETVVREQAVIVLSQLTNRVKTVLPIDPTPWTGLFKRLAGADWFTAKISACGLAAPVLGLLPQASSNNTTQPTSPTSTTDTTTTTTTTTTTPVSPISSSSQFELIVIFKELCQDETPMVRRAAAKYIGSVLKQVGWNVRDDLGTVSLPALCRDEQDSVRLLAIASLADVGLLFGQQNNAQYTIQYWLPLVKEGATDRSWRVRHNLAKQYSEVANVLGISGDRRFQNEQSLVMACFVSLLSDGEAEVRAAAVGHLARMIAWGGPIHFTQHLQPLLPALADDAVMEVRSKCALSLMEAAHGGTLDNAVILQAFGPLLESFLQDEFHEVQLQVLTNLSKIAHLLPGLTGVVTNLLQMSKAANWRVREAIGKILPHLAEARGLDFFSSVLLEPAWLVLLMDPVATVRMAIVQGMGLLVRVAGEEWVTTNIMTQLMDIYNHNTDSYLVRMTIIHAHIEIATAAPKPGQLWKDAVILVLRGLGDKVANVRMISARGLGRIFLSAQDNENDFCRMEIHPALDKRLQEEEDDDCRRACQISLNSVA